MVFVCRVSRSETSGTSQSSNVQVVCEYLKEELLCEGSELCFEEVRAAKYFRQVKLQQEDQTSKVVFGTEPSNLVENNKLLDLAQKMGVMYQTQEKLDPQMEVSTHTLPAAEVQTSAALNMNSTQHSSQDHPCSRRSSRRSLGLRLDSEPVFIREAPAVVPGHHQERRRVADEPPCPPVLTDSSVPLPAQQMAPSPQEVSSSAEDVLLHEDPEINQ